jgi:hypothetical protein
MKYVLMFASTKEEVEQWERMPTPEQKEAYEQIFRWFEENGRAGRIANGGAELQGPHTATTVRFKGDRPVVTDGPFLEAKEIIGGFTIINVPDLDAAIALAKSWPGRGVVEIRPIVDHGEQ